MKTTIKGILTIVASFLLASSLQTFAIVGLEMKQDGTNLVMSWPSLGYEHYLIQYRATLDPSTPWENLTNNYPANSTNRTTFILYGMSAPPGSGGGGGGEGGPPELDSLSQGGGEQDEAKPTQPWAMPADGSAPPVPLLLYPPDFDLSDFLIYNPEISDWVEGSKYSRDDAGSGGAQTDGPQPGGWDELPQASGFFRVFHIPDWSFNVTNYTYDGPTFFPVDFKDYRDLVANIQVLLNGVPSPYAEFMPNPSAGQTNWGMGIYFDGLTNGTYQIQLVTTLLLNDEIGDSSVFLVLSNLVRSIVVFNQVTFPDWNDFIQGDTYTFNAQTANPNTDWWIDIYDAGENYVATGSGHTTNGQVSWTWDLYDWLGNNRDDFDSDPYFFSEITFSSLGDGPQITKPTRPLLKGYPDRGEWLVAFQDRRFSDAPAYPADCQEKYEEAMANTRGAPILVGDTAYSYPLKFGTNVYTQAERDQGWTNLLGWIGDLYIRNFYYHGHGNARTIGGDRHTLTTNGTVTGGTVTSSRSKSKLSSWEVAQKTKYNRYRFVFLDGCSTAAGDWPNAFNISKTNHDISFYENHSKHPRPSVFVGWNETIGNEPRTGVYKRLDFQNNWMGIWANTSPLPSIKQSLEDANTIYDWLPIGTFRSKIRYYGYQEMTIRDYNRKGDWRWP
jgi:hypothetical protein